MDKNIFRSTSVEALSSPEQLDRMVTVTGLRGWIALAAALCLLAAAVVWGFTGEIENRVNGQGIILASGGIRAVYNNSEGIITDVMVKPGDYVRSGETVALISGEKIQESKVVSNITGKVIEIKHNTGDMLHTGEPIVSIEALEAGMKELEGFLYVPAEEGQRIVRGMKVYIVPDSLQKEDDGYMIGQVISVSEYPVTRQYILKVLDNDELADLFSKSGPVVEIKVDMIEDSSTPSGYKWTNSKGPSMKIHSGTLCSGLITVSKEKPVKMIFRIQ